MNKLAKITNIPDIETDAGFSLIEVLVTLLIVSFLFAGIFGFVSQLGTIKRMTTSVSEQTEITALRSFLNKRISNARRSPIFSEGFLQQRFFIGTKEEFTFVSEVRRGALGQGLFDVTIKWNKQKKTLYERHAYRRLDNKQSNIPVEYALFQDIENLSISYGSYSLQSESFSWSDDWNAIKSLPSFIRLSGAISNSTGSQAFSLLVPLN